jgi:hypothetical protein
MKLQKLGGVASLANGILSIALVFMSVALLPRLNLTGFTDLLDPVKGIAAWKASPVTFFLGDIDILLWGIAPFLVVLALRERLQAGASTLTQVALLAISIASGFYIVMGIAPFAFRSFLISTGDASAYRAIAIIHQAVGNAADHTCGWSLFLIGWAAIKTAALPRILACLIVFTGLFFILDFLVGVFAPAGVVLFTIMSFWLGIKLLQTQNQTVVSSAAKVQAK